MDLKHLFEEDRAVSPVIGVILTVAITVILAAVIGTFVLGLGDRVSILTPSASFSFDYTNQDPGNDTLEISHNGGDTISGSGLSLSASGVTGNDTTAELNTSEDFWGSSDVSAGTSVLLDGDDFNSSSATNTVELDGATVRVVWSAESGDSSAVLGTWNGPDA
jgi:flagellin-like protein